MMTSPQRLAQIAAWRKAHPDKVALYQKNRPAIRRRYYQKKKLRLFAEIKAMKVPRGT